VSTVQVDITDVDNFPKMVELWFMFSMIWSICCSVDEDGRKKIDAYLREIDGSFPNKDSVYEYYVEPKTRSWIHWEEKLKQGWKLNPRCLNDGPCFLAVSCRKSDSINSLQQFSLLFVFIADYVPADFKGSMVVLPRQQQQHRPFSRFFWFYLDLRLIYNTSRKVIPGLSNTIIGMTESVRNHSWCLLTLAFDMVIRLLSALGSSFLSIKCDIILDTH